METSFKTDNAILSEMPTAIKEANHNNFPDALRALWVEVKYLRGIVLNQDKPESLPPTIPLKKAAEISGKTANALRVQISLGNLKCLHRGSRIYLDTKYFERWLRGEDEPENDPREILKK